MPIYTYDDKIKTHPEIERYRTKEELLTSTAFSSDVKLNTILQFIGGMTWEVESFFTQVGNVNDQTSEISLDTGFEQRYYRISKLKIYLQSNLDNINPEELKGTFIINANFLPKINDYFIANVLGGRLGLFTITKVDKNTYNNHPCYTCDFELYCFLENENIDLYNKLIEKTIKDFVYNDDYKFNQNTPVLTTNEYNIREDIKVALNDLINYYLNNFIHKDNKILAYPTKEGIYTDTYLLDFLYKILSTIEFPMITKIHRVDFKDPEIRNTVLDLILLRNPQMLNRCDKYLDFIPVKKGRTNLTSRHISLIDVDYIIGKADKNNEVISEIEIDKKFKPNDEANLLINSTKSIKQAIKNIQTKHNNDFLFSNLDLNLTPEHITKDKEVKYLEKDEVKNDSNSTEIDNNNGESNNLNNTDEIINKENNTEETNKIESENNTMNNENILDQDNKDNVNETNIEENSSNNEIEENNNSDAMIFDHNFNNQVNTKVNEQIIQEQTKEQDKPIKITIQPIKATKQYSLFKKK